MTITTDRFQTSSYRQSGHIARVQHLTQALLDRDALVEIVHFDHRESDHGDQDENGENVP